MRYPQRANPETVWANAAVLSHGLDKPAACPHSPRPTTRPLRSLSIIQSNVIPVSPTLAPLYQFYPDLTAGAVPLLSWHSQLGLITLLVVPGYAWVPLPIMGFAVGYYAGRRSLEHR